MGMDTLSVKDLTEILTRLSCYAFQFAYSAGIIFVILSGIRYMMAGGNSEKATAAKKNFAGVLIGLLVILGVSVIITSIAYNLDYDLRIIPLVTCKLK